MAPSASSPWPAARKRPAKSLRERGAAHGCRPKARSHGTLVRMSRLPGDSPTPRRLLCALAVPMTLTVIYACSDNDGVGAPIGVPDAGRDVGYTVAETSTVDPDASSTKPLSARSAVAVGATFACVLAKDRTCLLYTSRCV